MTVEHLLQSLQDRDVEVRRRAVVASDGEPDAGVCDVLLRALGDEDWRVRKEAVQVAIRRAEELSLIPRLVDAICQGDNVGLRNAALDVLQGLGERAAPTLVLALPKVPDHARKFVVEALGDSGGPIVVEELSRAAMSDDPNVACEAIEALSRVGGERAEQVIRSRLSAGDPFLRMAALDALNRRGVRVTWEELSPLLEDRLLRRVAISALGRTGRSEAITPLFLALTESAVHVVAAAAVAVVRLASESEALSAVVAQRLAELSQLARLRLRAVVRESADAEARRAAAALLVEIQDRDALASVLAHLAADAPLPRTMLALRRWGQAVVDPLLSLYRTLPSPRERAVALELSCDLTLPEARTAAALKQRVRQALHDALLDGEHAVIAAAYRCLTAWGEEEDARLLADCALSPDLNLARQAARALEEVAKRHPEAVEHALRHAEVEGPQAVAFARVVSTVGGPTALEHLQGLMSSDDNEVRRAAVHGLGRVGGARAKSLVALALADEDADVRVVAAQELGRMRGEDGQASGVDELLLALRADLPHVRAAVARALGETGSHLGVEPLGELLRDPDSGVAMAAVEALGRINPEGLVRSLEAALQHEDSEVIKAALRALFDSGDAGTADALSQMLNHAAWDVRQLAAELLGQLGDTRVVGALESRFDREPDTLVQTAIQTALGLLPREGL